MNFVWCSVFDITKQTDERTDKTKCVMRFPKENRIISKKVISLVIRRNYYGSRLKPVYNVRARHVVLVVVTKA